MTTEDLIRALAAGPGVSGQSHGWFSWWRSVAATAFVAVVFFSRLGFRDDIDDALRTVRFIFKFVVIVPLAVATAGAMFHSAGPLVALGCLWPRLCFLPFVLLCAGVGAELLTQVPLPTGSSD